MKKHLITALAIALLLTGCSGNAGGSDVTDTGSSAIGVTTAAADTQTTPPTTEEVVRKDRAYLTLDTEENIISAEVILFDNENKTKLEQAQTDALKKYINDRCGADFELTRLEKNEVKGKEFSAMSLTLDAELKNFDDDVISIVYTGELTDKAAAHPTHLFYSLNLDAETLEPMAFAESYIVGEELYNVFAENSAEAMTAKWGEEYATELGTFAEVVCDADTFISGVTDGRIASYYTDTKVGLSFPLPFVLGGHIEVEVPYVQLDLLKYTSDSVGANVLMREGLYKVYYEVFPETPNEADYFISGITEDSTVVSVYLGTYSIRDVSAGGILVGDVDGDRREEVVILLGISEAGDTLTQVYRLEGGMLERVAELKTESNVKCEYLKGKKAKLTSDAGTFEQEVSIAGLFDNAVFDKNGKATSDGIVTVKPIREIKLNGTSIEYVATIALDTIDAFDLTYTLSVKDDEYVLTPVSVSPIA